MKAMKKIIKIAVLFLLFPVILLSQNGSTGLPFLKLGVGARSVAMGEAYTAIADDPSATFYNPAALSLISDPQVMLMHKQWIAGTTTEFLGAALPLGKISFGFGLNTTNVDGIEIRDQPGPPDGTFGLHDFDLSASAGYRLDSSLSIGVTGKFLYEKIFIDEASGLALDAGALFRLNQYITAAAAITNIGSMSALRYEATTLPAAARAGIAFADHLTDMFSLTTAADFLKTFQDSGSRLHLGGELLYDDFFAIRGGYQIGYEAKGISAGFGIAYGAAQFDYAYVPFSETLGDTHTFALTFRF
jgi:Uncharacterised protein family (UPF0164)